jgi:hypothetical protein
LFVWRIVHRIVARRAVRSDVMNTARAKSCTASVNAKRITMATSVRYSELLQRFGSLVVLIVDCRWSSKRSRSLLATVLFADRAKHVPRRYCSYRVSYSGRSRRQLRLVRVVVDARALILS